MKTSAAMIDYHSFSCRVAGLYRLPAVAMEAVELTNDPEVDVETLSCCLEKDPVLTARVLRVVNSPLFG
jgi:HD-like signal output (HDOD) protein